MKRPMPSLSEAVLQSKADKIHPRAVQSNRSSMMGLSCTRRIVYERTRWQDKKLHDATLQSIFDVGTFLEDLVISDLKGAGFRVVQQQRDLAIPEYEITGHIDFAVEHQGDLYPIDAKTMSPHVWEKVDEPQDFFESNYEHLRSYPTQILLYAHMLHSDWACLYCINKVTGVGKDIWFFLPDFRDVVEVALEKAATVTRHVRAGTLPDRITDLDTCARCPFGRICYPDKQYGPEVVQLDSDELEAMLERWWAIRGAAREFETLDDDIKRLVKASGAKSAEAGPFVLVVKDRVRKEWYVEENLAKVVGEVRKHPYKQVYITRKGESEHGEEEGHAVQPGSPVRAQGDGVSEKAAPVVHRDAVGRKPRPVRHRTDKERRGRGTRVVQEERVVATGRTQVAGPHPKRRVRR